MPRNARASTASGLPDHLVAPALPGVEGTGGPLPPQVRDQIPQPMAGISGSNLPLDPLLAMAGAYWNEQRYLVRKDRRHNGPPRKRSDGSWVQPMVTRERHVAPPGMTLEDAREKGLDFFSPQLGWIRGGAKREAEYPENLGMVDADTSLELEEIAPPDSDLSE